MQHECACLWLGPFMLRSSADASVFFNTRLARFAALGLSALCYTYQIIPIRSGISPAARSFRLRQAVAILRAAHCGMSPAACRPGIAAASLHLFVLLDDLVRRLCLCAQAFAAFVCFFQSFSLCIRDELSGGDALVEAGQHGLFFFARRHG